MEQNERIATLESQLESLSRSLERIETKLDAYSSNFITRSEAQIRFENMEKELREVKENRKANNALIVSVASVAVTFIFALVNYVSQ